MVVIYTTEFLTLFLPQTHFEFPPLFDLIGGYVSCIEENSQFVSVKVEIFHSIVSVGDISRRVVTRLWIVNTTESEK